MRRGQAARCTPVSTAGTTRARSCGAKAARAPRLGFASWPPRGRTSGCRASTWRRRRSATWRAGLRGQRRGAACNPQDMDNRPRASCNMQQTPTQHTSAHVRHRASCSIRTTRSVQHTTYNRRICIGHDATWSVRRARGNLHQEHCMLVRTCPALHTREYQLVLTDGAAPAL
jgi:hypothetical protein